MQAFVRQQLHEAKLIVRSRRWGAVLGASERQCKQKTCQQRDDGSRDTELPQEIRSPEARVGNAALISVKDRCPPLAALHVPHYGKEQRPATHPTSEWKYENRISVIDKTVTIVTDG